MLLAAPANPAQFAPRKPATGQSSTPAGDPAESTAEAAWLRAAGMSEGGIAAVLDKEATRPQPDEEAQLCQAAR